MTGERISLRDGGSADRLSDTAATADQSESRASAAEAANNAADATHAPHAPDAPVGSEGSGGSATSVKTKPARPRVDRLPPWNVLLHNDEKNEMGYVIETIVELTTLNPHDALIKMIEAHKQGVALLLTVHREYAELLQEQFASKRLTVTIEPDR